MQRTRLFKSSIFRFTLIYTAVFGLSVALPFGLVYETTVSSIDRETNAAIVSELRALGDEYERLGLESLVEILNERSLDPTDRDAIYLLVDDAFRPLAGNILEWPKERIPDPAWLRFDMQIVEGGQSTTHRIRSQVLHLSGGSYLLVGRDMQQRRRVQSSVRGALGWALALALGIGIPGGIFVSRWVLRRVERMAETSLEINQGDMRRRMPVGEAGDEFDRLASSLNAMLDRIEQLMTGMRAVTDSVAHDLRAPLTHVKGRIELTLRGPRDAEAYRSALTDALAETDRILDVFNALVAVAQAESGVTRDQMAVVDVGDLARDVVDLYEPLAEDRGLALVLSAADGAWARAHRQLLAQALSNLIDNAIKYTPEGGRIAVGVRRADGQVEIEVGDSGPGIPEGERERALERFARIGHPATPGYGLGLSLVAAVARLHDAKLAVGASDPGRKVSPGLKVSMVLPGAAEPMRAADP